ncbi:hypothetical protein K7X08_033896 [Anisodus acutangulus]|uniref:PB1 domain-containing protein n=1 Tax=Anisodus acutangulus TaxID=402998 RepID=A0A9Q1M7J5_9SOLA|nr:hypothetical protein K7X08_033896 [Anisodus acutangulus]
MGKYEMAMQDVQMLLDADGNHRDGLEDAGRLSMMLGPRQEDLQSRPSPAALGASAVGAASIAGLGGPCLPSRSMSKKPTPSAGVSVVSVNCKPDKPSHVMPDENGPSCYDQKEQASIEVRGPSNVVIRWRPLKFVYDHDIRLAQMPVNCSFRVLREIVMKRFPMSKSVLVKYKDIDGDLVTITCTAELRLAESWVDSLVSKAPDADEGDSIGMLRLHIVEVSPEQEPALLEEEEERPVEMINKTEKATTKTEDPECKEVEMDDWLFEFAQLFRIHVGIDPDAHIDLHELGMELSSEALEETVTTRKRMPIDDSVSKEETMATKLQAASNLKWQNFTGSVLAKKEDLSNWDPTETLALFESAEEKMKAETQMWEKLEELRANELKDPSASKKDELLKRRKKPEGEVSATGEISADEAAQQAAVMRSQIHLFWGNMLFEWSQVECKLGLTGWKVKLDTAVERFKLAGASEIDISTILKKHCSNEESTQQMVESLKTEGNDSPNDQNDVSKV